MSTGETRRGKQRPAVQISLLAAMMILCLTGCPVVIDLSNIELPDPNLLGQDDEPAGEVALSSLEQTVSHAINAQREAHMLPALELRIDLVEVARAHSQDMIDRDYFSHVNPDGEDPFDRMRDARIAYNVAGENIAWNNYPNAADVAVAGWMGSEGHRENILRESFTHTGIGVATAEDGRHFFTQVFIGSSKSVPEDQIYIYYYAP